MKNELPLTEMGGIQFYAKLRVNLKSLLMLKSLFLPLLIFCSMACSSPKQEIPKDVLQSLKWAGPNKQQLLDVVAHYGKNPSDSLKLKAAYYLITNMPGQSHFKTSGEFDVIFTNVRMERERLKAKNSKIDIHEITILANEVLIKSIDSIQDIEFPKTPGHFVMDITTIKSDFIIKNIDLAFKAYSMNPLKLCSNFEEFLKYVLPYKVGVEPIEYDKREAMHNQYKWVYDSLKIKSLENVIGDLYKEVDLCADVWGDNFKYKGPLSMSQIEDIRFGTCTDLNSYFINVLRSLGIPCGLEVIPRWGNHYKSVGHSFVFYLTQKGFNSFSVGLNEYSNLKPLYRESSIPKVFRSNYDSDLDVTSLYKKTHNIQLDILWNGQNVSLERDIYIGVFDTSKNWDIIQKANKIDDEKAYFSDMGTNIVYLMFTKLNEVIYPLNYPFKLLDNGEIHFFNPDETFQNATFTRKYPPFVVRDKKEKLTRIKSLNDCTIEGSGLASFQNFDVLHCVEGINSSNNLKFWFNKKKCYKHFRLKSKNGQLVNIANFKLLDINGMAIKNWKTSEINGKGYGNIADITDSNPLTHAARTDFEAIFNFEESTCVSGFEIQPRNDDNNIKPGDIYELYYWDKKWKNLGRKKANDTSLIYSNVPKNSLLWLKNKTRGVEENVFSIDETGNQFWHGVSEYRDIVLD